MNHPRLVFIILALCGVITITMIVLINLPRKNSSSFTMPVLYPTSVPFQQRSVFPSNPPYPAFQSDTSKFQYMGDILYNLPPQLSLPTQMAGYSVDSYSVTAPQATSLARTFEMNESPEITSSTGEQTLSWEKGEERLAVSLQSGYIEYTNARIPGKTTAGKSVTRKEEVLEKATSFLRSHGLVFSDISPSPSDVTYYIDDTREPAETETFEEANLFAVSLPRKLDGIPVVANFGNMTQSVLWLDSYGTVKKLSFQYAAVQRGTVQEIMPLETAKNAVPKEGVTVHLGKDDRSIEQGDLVASTFTSVNLGYFDDRETRLFYPIFIFRGTALSRTGSTYDITVYLPALAR